MDDVIPEILRRLPVKDLLRFRSVSKPWRSLIDSPIFTKLHLNTHHLSAIVLRHNPQLSWINVDSPTSASANLPRPINAAGTTSEIVGPSSDGLVVFINSGFGLFLWNPATRKHRRFRLVWSAGPGFPARPVSKRLFGLGHDAEEDEYERFKFGDDAVKDEYELLGFGHDAAEDEYELVGRQTFESLQSLEYTSVFTVHCLKAKTSKRVQNLTFPAFITKGCTVVRNAFHWIMTLDEPHNKLDSSLNWTIYALDIGSSAEKKFREVPKPESGTGACRNMTLLNLSGRLCLIRRYAQSERYVMWTMNEYGTKESWAELLSVGPAEIGVSFKYAMPVEFRDGGNKVLLETGKGLALFDLRSKTVENFEISGVDEYRYMCTCVESLVRLDWNGGSDSEEEKAKPSGKKSGTSRDSFLSKGFKLKL